MNTGDEVDRINLPSDAGLTYSSHGEDAVLLALFEENGGPPEYGFYVDVGAFHPTAVSNTALLHAAGWRGINIEPNPIMAKLLREGRPQDVTLELAVGAPRRNADLFFFGGRASSNTLDPEFAERISVEQEVAIKQRIPVDVVPLADVLAEHLPAGQAIDFLNVDVEGLDAEVLESNDWERFRPRIVAVEDLSLTLADPESSAILQLMVSVGYRFVAHAIMTSFYIDESWRHS